MIQYNEQDEGGWFDFDWWDHPILGLQPGEFSGILTIKQNEWGSIWGGESHMAKKSAPKPPVGVQSFQVWWEGLEEFPDLGQFLERYIAVCDAVKRYRDAKVEVPMEWLEEIGARAPYRTSAPRIIQGI